MTEPSGESPTELHRRRFLQAMGLGAASFALQSSPAEAKAPNSSYPQGKLVLIGGNINPHEYEYQLGDGLKEFDPHGIMQRMAKEVGGLQGKRVIVVTCASENRAELNADHLESQFKKLGAEYVTRIVRPEDANSCEFASLISNPETAMVFFAGGDQVKLAKEMHNSEVLQALRTRLQHDKNFMVAGTSAGAAAMTSPMIYEDGVKEGGLGLLKDYGVHWVDTHVDEHHLGFRDAEGDYVIREGTPVRDITRIRRAMVQEPQARLQLGIAIDGSVAVMLDGANARASVFGETGKKVQFLGDSGTSSIRRLICVGNNISLDTFGIGPSNMPRASVGRP